jgi:cytochrome c oxidase cbb3-type subunit 3
MSDNDTNTEPFDGIKESHKNSPLYLNILYFCLISWAVIFMGYYLFSGWSSHGEFQEKMNAHQEQTSQEGQSGGY